MALSEATITYDLSDMVGADFDAGQTRVWVTTNVPGGAIADTVANVVRLGDGLGTIAPDGTGSVSVWTPGTGSNPASWQTLIHVSYPTRVDGWRPTTRTFGPFTITASADLSDLIVEQEVPPKYVDGITAQLQGYVDDAQTSEAAAAASAAAAQALVLSDLGTTDGQTRALLENPASQSFAAMVARIIPGQATVVAPTPVASATTNRTNLQAAIDACPEGGQVRLKGRYEIDAALVIAKSIVLRGDGAVPKYLPRSESGSSTSIPPGGLLGTVIVQTTAGADILDMTASAISPRVHDLGLQFAAGLASTGHGVNALCAKPYTAIDPTGHDMGLCDFLFVNVMVYGHDGNHYAFAMRNPQYGTFLHPRSWGGGGYYVECDKGPINSGNIKMFHPYASVFNAGTAAGIGHSAAGATHPGRVNLIQYYSPQINVTAGATGINKIFDDMLGAVAPAFVSVYEADFENITALNQVRISENTMFFGNHYINNFIARLQTGVGIAKGAGGKLANDKGQFVAIGYNALQEATSSHRHVAVGYNALQKVDVDYATGVGNQAGKFQTGRVTAVGADALLGADGLSVGLYETAVGYRALASLRTGDKNTAVGDGALSSPQVSSESVAVGNDALHGDTTSTGAQNTGIGVDVMYAYTTGDKNVGVGYRTLRALTTGVQNTSLGYNAGQSPGGSATHATTTGNNNVDLGYQAGESNSVSTAGSGSNRVALGWRAMAASNGVAIGATALADASGAVAIGRDSTGAAAQTTTQNEILLGTFRHTTRLPGPLKTAASTSTTSDSTQINGAGLNVPHGAAPAASKVVDGDIWTTTTGMFVRINGVNKTVTLT